MKILVANPPWLVHGFFLFGRRFGIRAGSRWPFSIKARHRGYMPYPGFMGYTVNYLKSNGIDAKFYDAIAERDSYGAFFKKVDAFKPEIIIQEISTPSLDIDLKITQLLHEKGYETCLAGPHASAYAQRLKSLPFVDYVLKGAYEYPALEMARSRRKGIYDYDVADLDDLPYPYRDGAMIHGYRDYNCLKKLAFPQLWIYASRGCAFRCDFCLWTHSMFDNKLSLRKASSVIGEVDDVVRRYNFRHIYFDDDCWNLGPESRLAEMADGLKRIGLPWTINARLDASTEEMFRYFVDRGCVGLRLGVESLSQRLLDIINKGLRVEAIINKIKFLEKMDVELYLLLMHYLPGESYMDKREQDGWIKKLGFRYQNPPCVPFPGTPYYKRMIAEDADFEKKVHWCEYDGGRIGNRLLETIARLGRG